MFYIRPCILRRGLKRGKLSENLARKLRQVDKCLDSLKLLGQGQLRVLTPWPEARATKLDQLSSQRVTLGGQELSIVKLVATHTMEDVGDLVLALGVANQVI